ncbi:hypothetical protein CLIB1444_15S01860 [[Candida] jaroonii]|uniref:Uncharacterized protein n=1 Tax=[Candida] jaroonii TaxID=467808 RepID=A0ACA9YF00_9ASCO|nr:hypothetical protein CLIB1444_15S01860 [[Candida] jaroonii]
MSLYSKLGPQGRALMNQGSLVESGEGPQELDFLIDNLRNPRKDVNLNSILGYIYHYLPKIKLEHNLQLVVASFLNNPISFQPGGLDFEQNYTIIEAFKAITDKKLTISQPTLTIKNWYTVILQELKNFVHFDIIHNSWKVLPIISGIQLSNGLRDDLYTNQNILEYRWFFQDWDAQISKLYKQCLNYSLTNYNPDNIINLTLLSYSITFKKDKESVKEYTGKLSNAFIINKLIQLLFSNHAQGCQVYESFLEGVNVEVTQKPVIKHLNRLCFLLENYFTILPLNNESFQLVMDNVMKIKQFNQALSEGSQNSVFNHKSSLTNNSPEHQNFWFLMKSIFFGECIVFQGVLTRFLLSNKGFSFFRSYNIQRDYRQISFKILECLYYLNHVLLSIGQGGFDSYNFIYYLSLEIILSNKHSTNELEKVSMWFFGYPNVNLYHEALNINYINRSRVLFVFGLWENYLQTNKDSPFAKEIFRLCLDIINNEAIRDYDLIEACHSVVLLCFSDNIDIKQGMQYVDLLTHQFPHLLSPHQLSIAVESIGKVILSKPVIYNESVHANSSEEFLEFYYFKCLNARPGLPIKPQSGNFTSAQPIPEISAESTIKALDVKKEQINIIKENKLKKPKDFIKLDILPDQPKKDYAFTKRLVPETSREALILSFINLIPYLPLSMFVKWLDKTMLIIEASNQNERSYLVDMLWKVISENLDLNRCEMAYRWWYETKLAVESYQPSKL